MDTAVVAENLTKRYGDTVALDGVSLSVRSGEVFCLIGPNGAGKTTLVRALTGTTTPDDGESKILDAPPEAVETDRLGVLPQSFSPPDRLTGRELLRYYAGLYATARDPETVLAEVGMADDGDTRYEHCSGGQQRRICVGAVLVNDPDLLFLDEPTTGIDPAGRRTVWSLVERLSASGTTVVLTTHDMAEAERLADRVGLLANGRLVVDGSPSDLIRDHGGPNRLTVELEADRGSGEEAERAPNSVLAEADALAELEYSISTARDGSAYVVEGVEPAAIGTVARALEADGIEYSGLAWSEPSLADVYLALADDVAVDGPETIASHETTVTVSPGTPAGDGERR